MTIARFSTDAEFLLARTRLESAGIQCFGRNEYTARIAGALSSVLGADDVELQVRESDVEEALAMLSSEAPLADSGVE